MKADWLNARPEGMVHLVGGGYTADIAAFRGANAVSLYHEETGADILRTPETYDSLLREKEFYGMPLLFPPNRISNGSFLREGKHYQMPLNSNDGKHYIHGILRYLSFEVLHRSENEVRMHLDMNDQSPMFSYFPHAFSVDVTYVLSAAGLEHTVTFKNNGQTAMPFGLGMHTALRVPFVSTSNPEHVFLKLPIEKRWTLTADMLPTQSLQSLSQEESHFLMEGIQPLSRSFSTMLFKLLPVGTDEMHEVVLSDKSSDIDVVYQFDKQYEHLVLWNGGGTGGYVCTEPMTWIIDAPNSTLPDAVSGYQALKAGEGITLVSNISVRRKESKI